MKIRIKVSDEKFNLICAMIIFSSLLIGLTFLTSKVIWTFVQGSSIAILNKDFESSNAIIVAALVLLACGKILDWFLDITPQLFSMLLETVKKYKAMK